MSCFRPIRVWQRIGGGKVIWDCDKESAECGAEIHIPCGKCIGCLLDRCNDHATRCWCETQTNENECCFITLTYNNENVPNYITIEHQQKFWKRLRYYYPDAKIKYFGCGEYGPKTFRPHWHFCIWGYKPKDLKFYKYNHNGDKLYTSKELKDIWGMGFVIIGELTYKSACYVSRYCTKKLFKKRKWTEKTEIKPECTICSKGIGLDYWNKFKERIIQNNGIHIKIDKSVKNKKIPKYFMKKWKEAEPYEYECYNFERAESVQQKWNEILSKTSLSEQEYLAMQERKLIEKSEQLLKRTNFI